MLQLRRRQLGFGQYSCGSRSLAYRMLKRGGEAPASFAHPSINLHVGPLVLVSGPCLHTLPRSPWAALTRCSLMTVVSGRLVVEGSGPKEVVSAWESGRQDESPAPFGLPVHCVGVRDSILVEVGVEPTQRCPNVVDAEGGPLVPHRTGDLATHAPPWDEAMTARWWRWAGHAGQLAAREPSRWVSRAVQWRNAWWLRIVRFAHAAVSGGRPVRLQRGHRFLGKRRWDAPLQQVIEAVAESDWGETKVDRDVWAALETCVAQHIS